MYQDLLEEIPPAKHANESAAAAVAGVPDDDRDEAAGSTGLGQAAAADANRNNSGDSDNGSLASSHETSAEAPDHATAIEHLTNAGDTGPGSEADSDGDTEVPQTPTAIANTLKAEQHGGSELKVENVVEPEDAKPAIDKRRALLRLQGLSDDMIDKILPIVSTTRKTQRQLPVDGTVCSPEMIAFFEGRDDATITGDCVKGIRNDGGPYGPAGMYARLLVKLGVDAVTAKTAGEVLADKVNHRIVAIRVNVVATINELRRRRAVADGLNPRAAKYLRVR